MTELGSALVLLQQETVINTSIVASSAFLKFKFRYKN